MSGLSTNSFANLARFDLPENFVPAKLEKKYAIYLEQYQKAYGSVYDFLNSTVKDVSIPGLTFNTVEQLTTYGKKVPYRGSTSPTDAIGRDVTLTCAIADFHTSYFIMVDVLLYHYMTPTATHLRDFVVTTLDNDRNGVFRIRFKDLVIKSLSDTKVAMQSVEADEKTLTLTFTYYDVEMEFLPYFSNETASGDVLDEYYDRLKANEDEK